MEPDFWHQRWNQNQIAFHEGKANALCVRHFGRLSLRKGARVFVPLCGKTEDIPWLMSEGYRVVGAELSEKAVAQLFDALGVEPEVSAAGGFALYSAPNVEIFVGDIFDLSAGALGPVDATYDRAALVALPFEMRRRYAPHLVEITAAAPQFLICFEYDQDQMPGPPFSVPGDEVQAHYGDAYDVALIESREVPGGLKKKCAATENAWLLTGGSPG